MLFIQISQDLFTQALRAYSRKWTQLCFKQSCIMLHPPFYQLAKNNTPCHMSDSRWFFASLVQAGIPSFTLCVISWQSRCTKHQNWKVQPISIFRSQTNAKCNFAKLETSRSQSTSEAGRNKPFKITPPWTHPSPQDCTDQHWGPFASCLTNTLPCTAKMKRWKTRTLWWCSS